MANNPLRALNDTEHWTKISGSFIAKGGEKYIVIGNFNNDSNSTVGYLGEVSQSTPLAIYYIDDVIVTTDSNYADSLFQSVPNINAPQMQVKVYPNPSKGVFNFQSQGINQQCNIEVYNTLGQEIYVQSLNIQNSTFSIDLNGHPAGIYLYRLTNKQGLLVQSGKLVIQ